MRRAHDFVDRASHLAFCNFNQMTIFDLNKGELASLLTYNDIERVHWSDGLWLLGKAYRAQNREIVLQINKVDFVLRTDKQMAAELERALHH